MKIAGENGKSFWWKLRVRSSTEERHQIVCKLSLNGRKVHLQVRSHLSNAEMPSSSGTRSMDANRFRSRRFRIQRMGLICPNPLAAEDRRDKRAKFRSSSVRIETSFRKPRAGDGMRRARKPCFDLDEPGQHVRALRTPALGDFETSEASVRDLRRGRRRWSEDCRLRQPDSQGARIRDVQRVRRLGIDLLASGLEVREPTQGLGKILGRSAIGIEQLEYGKGAALEFGRKPESRERSAIFLNRGDVGWVQIREQRAKRGRSIGLGWLASIARSSPSSVR